MRPRPNLAGKKSTGEEIEVACATALSIEYSNNIHLFLKDAKRAVGKKK